MKLLLDTNVAIALEDPKPVNPSAAAFAEGCERHGIRRYVADANYEDVSQDKDVQRQRVTLSKLNKFPRLSEVALPSESQLEKQFGVNKNENDRRDLKLLGILASGAVDLLISEDGGLHSRADRSGFGNRVLRIQTALDWLRQSYEPESVELPFIEEVPAYQVELDDPFFHSLQNDYPDFLGWFKRKCIGTHRPCWIVRLDDHLAGLVIRKTEPPEEADCLQPSGRILKISTFKMSDEYRGEKFGEQLLKQILWWAQANRFDIVYLTAFPKQSVLIRLLESYGFRETRTLHNGEKVLQRSIVHGLLPINHSEIEPLECAHAYYPRYYDGPECQKFVVPIRPEYHAALFPEVAERLRPAQEQLRLFGADQLTKTRTPGNTIRKVYLCRASTNQVGPGDLMYFYATKQPDYLRSQCVTSVGIVEQVQIAHNPEDLIRMTARRSVFSIDQLEEHFQTKQSPMKVIDFLLLEHFGRGVSLNSLLQNGIFNNHPPQTITLLSTAKHSSLSHLLKLAREEAE